MEMPSRVLDEGGTAPARFRAANLAPAKTLALAAPTEKMSAGEEQPSGRLRVGGVRALAKASSFGAWTPVEGGFVTRLIATSDGAQGMRVKLALGTVPGEIEARVQGASDRIESMLIDPALGNEAWTPWTEGASQVIELFSPVLPSADAVRVEALVHFTESLFTKAAGTCTVPVSCTTGDPLLDAAVAERKKSVTKISFVDGSSAFLCTATLLNTEKFPAPYILTANHCINNTASAGSISSAWFYENTDCFSGLPNPNWVQVSGGASLVFPNHNVDSTLLLMNRTPPAGATYSAWSKALLPDHSSIVSISHPRGDTTRLALGNTSQQYRVVGYPQDMYGVLYTRGIIEPGSSGSGLFTFTNGSLQLRGVLSGSTIRNGSLSCNNTSEEGLYTRFEIFEPEVDQYIRTATQAADDAPNRVQDLFLAPITDPSGVDQPLNLRGTPLAYTNRRIDYAGDLDAYRFSLTQSSTVTLWTEGAIDTVGALYDSRGIYVDSNDDGASGDTNFKITKTLAAGTYYVQVGHWDADGVGTYTLKMSAAVTPASLDANYTDLWWNADESGWGLNVNHQGDMLFATLFTYDAAGQPMWLVMSNGVKQSDGSYLGSLFRTTGTPFNAQTFAPLTGANYTSVGTMRFIPQGVDNASLLYFVSGTQVVKSVTRNIFGPRPTCTFTTGERSDATNYQDLWYNPFESGWGVNVTHDGDTLFATLFIYDANSQGTWLVMSNGNRTGARTYSGTLYRTTGPVFNASPFPPVPQSAYAAVGTMTFTFTSGNAGTLSYSVNGTPVTKTIQRLVVSSPTTVCAP